MQVSTGEQGEKAITQQQHRMSKDRALLPIFLVLKPCMHACWSSQITGRAGPASFCCSSNAAFHARPDAMQITGRVPTR